MFPAMPRVRIQPRLRTAHQLLKEGATTRARAACRRVLRETPDDPSATHLLGLVHKADGDPAFAERCFRKSIELEPASAGFRADLGALLHELGRPAEAEYTYREALALEPGCKPARVGLVRVLIEMGRPAEAEPEAHELTRQSPSDPQSWSLLAVTFKELGRHREAEALCKKSLDIAPGYAQAHQQLGAVWSRMDRPQEALKAFTRARSLGASGSEIAVDLGRVHLQMYQLAEAERAFADAVRADPRRAEAQLCLARTRFMRGDPEYGRDIVSAADAWLDDPCLALRFGVLLRQAGLLERAERHLERSIRRHGRTAGTLSALAGLYLESGRPGKARAPALEAVKAKPQDAELAETAVATLLACAEPELAWYYVARQRSRQPLDQGWLAYEAVIVRLLDPPRYKELYDFDRFIRVYEVDAPDAWPSLTGLNEAVSDALRPPLAWPTLPIGGSFRGGSRTSRNLLTEREAAVEAMLKAFESPLREYVHAMGTDASHPVTVRNSGEAQPADAWAVRLRQHGYQMNHFHRRGWISGIYYVTTPAEVADTERMPGWTRFGEPRFPVPGANPEHFIKPVAGRLVLFPSCFWHGCNPITGPDPSVTVSFYASPSSVNGASPGSPGRDLPAG